MVQLSALRNGEDERGGDRVGVDRPATGREQGFGKGASVNPTLRKVREGWGTRQFKSGARAYTCRDREAKMEIPVNGERS